MPFSFNYALKCRMAQNEGEDISRKMFICIRNVCSSLLLKADKY